MECKRKRPMDDIGNEDNCKKIKITRVISLFIIITNLFEKEI